MLGKIRQKIGEKTNYEPETIVLDRVEMEHRVRIHKWKGENCPYSCEGKCSNTEIRCGERFQYNLPESEKEKNDIHVCNYTSMLSLNKANVLVVDDEDAIREICSTYLNQLGIAKEQIVCVSNVADAKKTLDQGKINSKTYSLIVSDIVMPAETGYGLVDFIVERNFNSRIILISGYYAEEDKANTYLGDCEIFPGQKPVVEFIKKPFSFADFRKAIDKVEKALSARN